MTQEKDYEDLKKRIRQLEENAVRLPNDSPCLLNSTLLESEAARTEEILELQEKAIKILKNK